MARSGSLAGRLSNMKLGMALRLFVVIIIMVVIYVIYDNRLSSRRRISSIVAGSGALMATSSDVETGAAAGIIICWTGGLARGRSLITWVCSAATVETDIDILVVVVSVVTHRDYPRTTAPSYEF